MTAANPATITDGAVAKASVAASTAYSRWTTRPNRDAYVFDAMREAASSALTAATPLIAAQALREAADAIRAEQDRRAASQWGVPASQRPQVVASCLTLHEAAKIVDGRADELERGTDQ